MTRFSLSIFSGSSAVMLGFAAISLVFNRPAENSTAGLPAFEFNRQGAASPEDAAKALFRGVAMESPQDFVQHLLLGVCDGSVDSLQKFAESLHSTAFSDGETELTFYGLRDKRKGMDPKQSVRIIGMKSFDTKSQEVAALESESVSTYYAERFVAVDVAGDSYDRRQYQTRVIVAQIGDVWYAMPRCRSALRFYEVADAMSLPENRN